MNLSPLQTDIIMVGGAGLMDTASTKYAFSNCSNCREVNPLITSDTKLIITKTVSTILVVGGCEVLRRKGHKKAAKVLRYLAVSIWLGVSINNLRMAER